MIKKRDLLVISSILISSNSRFGGAKRAFFILKRLAVSFNIHLLHMDVSDEGKDIDGRINEFHKTLFLPSCREKKSLWKRIVTAPMDNSSAIRQELSKIVTFVRNSDFDVAIVIFPHALSFLTVRELSSIKKIIYIEDDLALEVLKNDVFKSMLKLFIKPIQYITAKKFYDSILHRVNVWIAISEQEREIVKSYFPDVNVSIIKYGIDIDSFPFLLERNDDFTLGFIGNYNHPPNLDAALFLIKRIVPYCRSKGLSFKTVIAGANIPSVLLDCDTSITLIESVGELSTFYKQIDALVCPVISGRGLRTKCVEAAAFGRPIIATPLGAEGLEDLEVITCPTMESFFAGISRLSTDRLFYQQIALSNRKVIEKRYTSAVQSKKIKEIVDSLLV